MDPTKFPKTRGPYVSWHFVQLQIEVRNRDLPVSATSDSLRETLEKDDAKDNCRQRVSFHTNDVISDDPSIPELMAEAHRVFASWPRPEQFALTKSAWEAAKAKYGPESRQEAKEKIDTDVAVLEEQMAALQIKLDAAKTTAAAFEESFEKTRIEVMEPLKIKYENEKQATEHLADVLQKLNVSY